MWFLLLALSASPICHARAADCAAVAAALSGKESASALERSSRHFRGERIFLQRAAAYGYLHEGKLKDALRLAKRQPRLVRRNIMADVALKRDLPSAVVRWQSARIAAKVDIVAARAMRARAYGQLGKTNKRDADVAYLLVHHPANAISIALESELGRLRLGEADRLARCEKLLKRSRYRQALAELRENNTSSPRWRRLFLEAMVRNGQRQKALELARRYVVTAPGDLRLLEGLAWTAGKFGAYDEVARAQLAIYKASDDDLRELGAPREVRAKACFYYAFAAYESLDYRVAASRFDACKTDVAKTDFASASLWYRALCLMLQDGDARRPLTALVKAFPRDAEADKYRYFLGRQRLRYGGGGGELSRLSKRAPTSYYGLLATRALHEPAPSGIQLPADALSRTANPRSLSARLAGLGLGRDAQALAKSAAELQAVGDYHRAWRQGFRLLPKHQVRDGQLVESITWRASYPKPFADLVTPAAEESRIGDDFIYAIMRTESGFLPEALSVVGAVGLMQLMPYTGRGIADQLHQTHPSAAELVVRSRNIRFGSTFLGISKREFGHTALAAAGYNGSPDNVARWLTRFGNLPPELFVERVPFKETRGYIKRVLSTAAVYRALDGAPLQIELPTQPFGGPPKSFTYFPRTY